MAESTNNPLTYYAYPGLMTDPGEHSALLMGLPAELPALCGIVQHNLMHIFWAESYGQTLSEDRRAQVNIRRAVTMLAQIKLMDDRRLTIPRPPEKRLIGNCRDFSVMLVTLLRHQGIPARARCGFAAYFASLGEGVHPYCDHWVCEYWNEHQARWIMVDAQLDALQVEKLGITFDPCDVPADQFLVAGRAWQLCRAGEADPHHFGIFDMQGLWFIRGNLVRDLAALNNMELLPWDSWGVIDDKQANSEENMTLLDHAASLTLAGNDTFGEVRAFYENDARLHVPDIIRSYPAGSVPETVDVTTKEIIPMPAQ
jgi:hypothetical protein